MIPNYVYEIFDFVTNIEILLQAKAILNYILGKSFNNADGTPLVCVVCHLEYCINCLVIQVFIEPIKQFT